MTSDDRPRLPRRKRLIFAAFAVTLALGLPLGCLFAIDVYLHSRYQRSAGFNVWGYRGPIVHGKRKGEARVAVFGGSTTFGYGVNWNEAFPAILEGDLAAVSTRPVSVVNLGYNNEGAYAAAFTMKDYAYLHYDVVILYDGYNDVMGDPRKPNLSVFRHDSPIFRLTGYLPIFPMIFKEKAAAMLHGGDTGAVYHDDGKTVFHPGLAARTAAGAINTAAAVGESLERQVGRVASESKRRIADADRTGCHPPWQQYCASVRTAVEYALSQNKQVLVVTQPYAVGPAVHSRHLEQQSEMAMMLERQFGDDRRVTYVDLGWTVDLDDPALSFDTVHLTPEGNRRLAAALVEPVLATLNRPAQAGEPVSHAR